MQLNISNFINISVLEAQAGVGNFNTSNLALFTSELPDLGSFGDDGFKRYVDPLDVATDFGTDSRTYKMALAIFSQQPNILTGGGQLVVILLGVATENLALDGVPASGSFKINYGGNATVAIDWDDLAGEIQTKVRAVPGLEQVVVTGTLASQSLDLVMNGVYGATPAEVTITDNSLMTSAPAAIAIDVTIDEEGESLEDAIVRTKDLVQYFGILVDASVAQLGEDDVIDAATLVQTLVKIFFVVSYEEADIDPDGTLDLLRSGGTYQTRGLYYGDDSDLGLVAILYAAAYAGRALSVDFSGSNTTFTMNFKDLRVTQPDPSMTQTIFNKAKAAGADIYASIQGVPKVVSFGANRFFDRVYNLLWFIAALQVAGFNYLAQAATKIPQTEAGMDGLKGAYRAICEQGLTNQYMAPGSWTSPSIFGVPADLIANIAQRGYYIYSQPVALQSQVDREDRKAPLVQIAIKEAGAIQESDVIINVNA